MFNEIKELIPIIVLVLGLGGIVIGCYKWYKFRKGKPSLSISLDISSRACSESYTHIGAVANITNTSNVKVKIPKFIWKLGIIGEFRDADIEEQVKRYTDGIILGDNIEFTRERRDAFAWDHWRHERLDSYTFLEPRETIQDDNEFVVQSCITSVRIEFSIPYLNSPSSNWFAVKYYDI